MELEWNPIHNGMYLERNWNGTGMEPEWNWNGTGTEELNSFQLWGWSSVPSSQSARAAMHAQRFQM